MSLETLPLHQLKPNADNPCTRFDPQHIEALAATILQQGVLQNLVVKRAKGRKVAYIVEAGGRRLRALQLRTTRPATATLASLARHPDWMSLT